MLHNASRPNEYFLPDDQAEPTAGSSVPIRDGGVPAMAATDRYGAGSRIDLRAMIIILIVHALLIAVLMQVRHQARRAQEAKLTVVNLSPPPPPPAAQAPPTPPSTPEVVAPPPIVRSPIPPVQVVQTTPQPVPPQASAPMIAAPPAPAAAPAAPAASPAIIQAGDLSTQMVSGKPPRYPVESRRKREQGTVVLALTLGMDGGVESIAVTQSSGFARLDTAARDAVKGWRWKPTVRGGQPVRVKGVVEIPFVLRVDAA